jgi:DNA mismatch repair protein MutL
VPVTTPVNAEIAIQPAESTSATATATVLRPDAGTLNDPGSDLSIEPISSPHPFPPQTRLSFDWTAIPSGSALQVHHAYLVQETPEGMLVIDQHALHERILYEQLRHRIRTGKLEVQRLLIPVPIELTAEQAALVLSVSEDLASLGLEVSGFGGNTVLLSSYPTLLARRMPHELFQGVVDELLATDRLPAKEVLLDHLLATMACKAAVKAGDPLSPEEITALLQLRHLAENSHHCPHGRPTSLLFTRQELDRQFKRI